MKEKLVQYFEILEAYAKGEKDYTPARTCFDQAFGALYFCVMNLATNEESDELIHLWELEWRPRFEAILYN